MRMCVRLCEWPAAAPRGVARCARRCDASARSHAGKLHLLAPPPAKQLGQEVQPHRQPQRLPACACAAGCASLSRAARDVQ
eukprot:3667259-Prymnesium_polylepis.1